MKRTILLAILSLVGGAWGQGHPGRITVESPDPIYLRCDGKNVEVSCPKPESPKPEEFDRMGNFESIPATTGSMKLPSDGKNCPYPLSINGKVYWACDTPATANKLEAPTPYVLTPAPSDRLRLYAKRAKMVSKPNPKFVPEKDRKQGLLSKNGYYLCPGMDALWCPEPEKLWMFECPGSIGTIPELHGDLTADSVVYCLYVEPEVPSK